MGLLEFLVENTTRSEDKESTIIELVDAVLWLGVVVWLPPRCVSGTIQVGVEKLELGQIGNILSQWTSHNSMLLLLKQGLQDQGQSID